MQHIHAKASPDSPTWLCGDTQPAPNLKNSMKRPIDSIFVSPASKNRQGFSLVELLVVLSIVAVLAYLSLPVIQGVRSTYDRKAAASLVMETIQNGRMSALQSGENVYVIFALATDSGISPDAMIVVGDQPIGSPATGPVLFTHWVKLPQNIRFRSSTGTLAVSPMPSQVSPGTLPPIGGTPTYAGIAFNSTGTLTYPSTGGLEIALYEGIRTGGTETALGESARATDSLSDSGLYDIVRLDRYSGRSWTEVSSLVQK